MNLPRCGRINNLQIEFRMPFSVTVIPENTSSRPNNNLNRNQTPKVDASKDLNISLPQIDVPPGNL
jgi:hypothetical protein